MVAGGSSLCGLLADLQHVGVDMEADAGEVLLRAEPWDVADCLLENVGNNVSHTHTNASCQLKPVVALQQRSLRDFGYERAGHFCRESLENKLEIKGQ